MTHVFRNPPRKGMKPTGYRPVDGKRDAEGRLILEYTYAPSDVWIDEAASIPETAIEQLSKRRTLLL